MNTSIKQASAVFIQRYATAAEWRANNPILYPGEIGIESDTGKIKVGGAIQSFWNDLDYAGGGADIVVYDSLDELPNEAEEDTIAVLPDVAIEMFNSKTIHIRYSAYQDGTDFTDEWSAGQNYIGIAVAKYAPVNKEAYEWSLFTSNIRLTTSVVLKADGWVDKVQTIAVPHIGESSSVFSTPHPAATEEYINHGVYLESATTENLTFSCVTLPNLDIQVNIQIVEPLVQPETDDSDDLPFNIIEVPTLEELPNDDQIPDGTMALIPTTPSTEEPGHTISSWNDLEDKPFYDETEIFPDVITWDGSQTDYYISIPGERLVFYWISNSTPKASELVGGQVVLKIFNLQQELSDELAINIDTTNSVDLSETITAIVWDEMPIVAIAHVDEASYEMGGTMYSFPKKGIYVLRAGIEDYGMIVSDMFVAELHKTGYEFTRLNAKVLERRYWPRGGAGYEETRTKEIYNAEALAATFDSPQAYILSDAVLAENMTYEVTVDGIPSTITIASGSNLNASGINSFGGNASIIDTTMKNTGEKFVIFHAADINQWVIAHKTKSFPETLKVNIKISETMLQTIDLRFMPKDLLSKQWRDMSVIDLTSYFDFAQSVLSGGTMINVSHNICADLLKVMKDEPVKLKVKFDTYTAIVSTLAQNFDTYCQFVDFVVLNGKLLYLYLSVNKSNFSFQCQEVVTKPYGT